MFINCKTEKEWLDRRVKFLTASDAGNYMGLNPYDPLGKLHLWEEKIGLRKRPDLSGKAAVRFGKKAEDHVRELFLLMHPEYELQYDQYGLYVSDDHPFMAATLDGLLLNKENATHEIYEGKTATVHSPRDLEMWRGGMIPTNYYCQVLHQSACVKWACGAWVVALVMTDWNPNESFLLQFHFSTDGEGFIEDRKFVETGAGEMWSLIQTRKRPGVAVTL